METVVRTDSEGVGVVIGHVLPQHDLLQQPIGVAARGKTDADHQQDPDRVLPERRQQREIRPEPKHRPLRRARAYSAV